MELTPQLLTDEIDFRIAVRGYDRHEVDDFLERVAVAVGQLQSQLTKAVDRAKKAEARLSGADGGAAPTTEDEPPSAGGPADETSGEAESDATQTPSPAMPAETVVADDDLNDELRRTLVLAQRTADMAIREAREQAGGIVADAKRDADRIRTEVATEAEQAREEARGRLIAEIRELEGTRETMRSDTEVLERYLGTERARVRETIQVLRRLVDEPERFRPAAAPELSPVTLPRELAAGPDASSGGPEAEAEADATESPSPDDSADVPDNPPTPSESEPAPEVTPVVSEPDAASGEGGLADEEEAAAPTDVPTGADPVPAETAPSDADVTDTADDDDQAGSEHLDRLFDAGDVQRDWRSGGDDRGDQGPHTQPVAAARFEEESDEAFLAELRRAMSDDEPLGPDAKG